MPSGFENVLKLWLSSGILKKSHFYYDTYKVPQGYGIASLIMNFMLDGLEVAALKGVIPFDRNKNVFYFCCGLVRYVDSVVIVLNNNKVIELVRKNVEVFLNLRGLQINEKKFESISLFRANQHKKDSFPSFDFLGFTFLCSSDVYLLRTNKKKILSVNISPSRRNVIVFKRELKIMLSKNSNLTAVELLQKLNPILRCWAMYFSVSGCESVLLEIDNYVYKCLWR
jgi:RNA-directed DNA polymerase